MAKAKKTNARKSTRKSSSAESPSPESSPAKLVSTALPFTRAKSRRPHPSHLSYSSDAPLSCMASEIRESPPSDGVLPPHGGYENLLSFQKSRIIYDATLCFCRRFVDARSRTRDQMTQAARSGKQNILEASRASGTSKETEIKLTNVARASLEELLEDYRDYLRSGQHILWDKNSREARFVRKLGTRHNAIYETYRTYIETRPGEIVANILICLIHQANYLLDQQIRRLEKDFLAHGGLRERMTRARLAARARRRGGNAGTA